MGELPIAKGRARKFGVICDPNEFTDLMVVSDQSLSAETYKTFVCVDVTEPNGKPSFHLPTSKILEQKLFAGSTPQFLVTVQIDG